MATPHVIPAFDAFLDHLVEKATPEEIIAFTVSPEDQQHATDLLERQSEGKLTSEETYELQRMAELDRLVSLLKAKAFAALKRR